MVPAHIWGNKAWRPQLVVLRDPPTHKAQQASVKGIVADADASVPKLPGRWAELLQSDKVCKTPLPSVMGMGPLRMAVVLRMPKASMVR